MDRIWTVMAVFWGIVAVPVFIVGVRAFADDREPTSMTYAVLPILFLVMSLSVRKVWRQAERRTHRTDGNNHSH